MNTKRLLKLAKFLDKLPREKFNLASVVSSSEEPSLKGCGSTACAIGWCPKLFPKLCEYVDCGICGLDVAVSGSEDRGYTVVAMKLFDISHEQAKHLFSSLRYDVEQHCGPKAVSKRIRDLAVTE